MSYVLKEKKNNKLFCALRFTYFVQHRKCYPNAFMRDGLVELKIRRDTKQLCRYWAYVWPTNTVGRFSKPLRSCISSRHRSDVDLASGVMVGPRHWAPSVCDTDPTYTYGIGPMIANNTGLTLAATSCTLASHWTNAICMPYELYTDTPYAI